ncbi:TetR family transcriptional regulator [Roseibium hamelinense]|uniref:TetR family transcriptional regulator n=1 Tax=Roseibium hamelinense TaxID=150831 RepID=A0A562TID2_9HYPH|nr:TetR/AcrR family transcriptional regulator [Roseibium hamelinense]MTI46162.1 TetR/AcrR family transcriptional regulator [Roseibium hamelinense]TWI92646.1 TetR family transcriptional regulator [Roseibium hamelinense]
MVSRLGQGRKFMIEDALEAATLVFWLHGYEGASISELTKAMGINPPSLYKAFGSKEDLFFKVVDHYNQTHGNFMSKIFEEETDGRALLQRLLLEAADHYPSDQFPGGCLVISAAVAVTETNKHVADRLASMRNDNVKEMASRDGVTPDMARFAAATLQGMSQQARDGASREDLRTIAKYAISALDTAL